MNNFKKLNIIVGWSVFLVATITYLLTIEPTTSFWDCGEFIATAFKLEVGHPPGAPLFMIISRFFALFAFGDTSKVAMMINVQSALSSSFTILFLFWSITHLAKKLMQKISSTDELDFGQNLAVIGSGVVGALAYTFSDTFWFSAVEAEVYAMSSLFTAAVFWAILKWEDVADEKYSNRWLILIAYLMGLSIGVHLLNLLAIPAIVLVYYFKKYEFSVKGVIIALMTSFLMVIILMYGVIQGMVWGAAQFELMFVNSFGLPFNSGFIFYILLIITGLAGGLYYTYQKNKPLLNTIILALTVVIIGYSSFAMILIRSSANPPMDENNPENAFSLKSYLNREQYGDRPLIYGEYYNAEPISSEENFTYIKGTENYVKIAKTNSTYIYDGEFSTIFPRMYSSNGSHIEAYKSWAGITASDDVKPSFGNNLRFFLTYQIGHMYFRYLMWNFAGRQNDEQSHGSVVNGNWISGISFLDAIRLGPQTNLPDNFNAQKGRNKYFLLPLIFGLVGLIFSFSYGKKDFWIVFALFFMTGIAIVLYLNQTPYQPRERDYAYAGSFYAFTIWIGLSVLAIYDLLRKISNNSAKAMISTGLAVLIPLQMLSQNWDDHDRSGRYTARDFASNYLNSCAPNAILFTYGDNDTFPLWYAQEVEGIRTDVRVVNLSLLSTDWYVDQMLRKAYESDVLPISFTPAQYVQGKRDIVPLYEVSQYLFNEKFEANYSMFKNEYDTMYQGFIEILKNSKFPEKQASDYNLISAGVKSVNALELFTLINTLSDTTVASKFEINNEYMKNLKTYSDQLLEVIANSYAPLDKLIEFVASDTPDSKVPYGKGELSFMPSKKMYLPVDKEKVIANGTVLEKDKSKVIDALRWQMTDSYILKSSLIVLDILAHNNWERPIYFATSVGDENYMGLQEYFRLEGFAYRLVPYKTKITEDGDIGDINTDILYENVMNKFVWGRVNEEDVLVDNFIKRVISIMEIRNVFVRLSTALLEEEKVDKAIEVLDKCVEILPDENLEFDYTILPIIENYYIAEQPDKANEIAQIMATRLEQELEYYNRFTGSYVSNIERDKSIAGYTFSQLMNLLQTYEQTEMFDKLLPIYSKYSSEMK